MGQARARKQQIAQLKLNLMHTPWPARPVLARAGDRMWLTTDTEFSTWIQAAHAITVPSEAQREFARLALIAERSGIGEKECQQWFELQLQQYALTKLTQPMPKPIIMAQSHK